MMLRNARLAAAALLIASLIGGVSSAGTINLGSFAGSTVSFNNLIENNGLPAPGPFPSLFAPVGTVGDQLVFGTAGFSVAATMPGVPAVLDHSISFSVVADPGQSFQTVTIQETFLANTGGGGLVQGFFGGPANTQNPVGVVSGSQSIGQSGNVLGGILTPPPLVYNFPTPVTQADFTIDNRLTAFIPPGVPTTASLAEIFKRGLTVTVTPVPEPTSAMIFACGFGLLTVRRRRR